MSEGKAIVVLVTCANESEARKIAERLLNQRLVACANIVGAITSLFHWQGAVAREPESLLIMKTRREHFEDLSRRVKELHSYDVPEIIAIPVIMGDAEYLDWVFESTAEAP